LLRAHRATSPEWPTFLHYYEEGMPFARYLEILEQRARGEHVPPDQVPSTFLFAFDGPRIIGRVTIRHELNESLLRTGGHIGYVAVPEFRRRATRRRCYGYRSRSFVSVSASPVCW
jgi:predicted acetyltransferase